MEHLWSLTHESTGPWCRKMTEAFSNGFKKTENLSEWLIYSPSGQVLHFLPAKSEQDPFKIFSQVKNPDWVLVGCKPQQLRDLKTTLNGKFKESLFVSMLAAVSEEDQMKILEIKDLIRIMPNLPVEFNDGITLLASNSAKGRLSSFQTLFSKLGTTMIVQENELEELIFSQVQAPLSSMNLPKSSCFFYISK